MSYGIFSGSFGDEQTLWMESVDGLEAAFNRMQEIAVDQPGKYFIFSPDSSEPIASIDTTNNPAATWPWL
jgi:hypothetical protein